jgi:hypothetical protein
VLATSTAQDAMKIGPRDVTCFDLAAHPDIMPELVKFAAHRTSGAVIVISGIESLSINERARLNFLHGATDSNSPFPKLAVFLTWDLTKRPVDAVNHNLFFESFVNEGSHNINARALVGRFKLIDLSGSADGSAPVETICSHFLPPTFSDTEPFDFTFILIATAVSAVVGWLWMQNASSSSDRSFQNQSRSVVESSKTPKDPVPASELLCGHDNESYTPVKPMRGATSANQLGVEEGVHEGEAGDCYDVLAPRRSTRIASTKKGSMKATTGR